MSFYRLEGIASFVKGNIIIDVGADHGELEVILEHKDNVKKVFAIENKKGPYQNLVNKINELGLKKVEPIYSDGLSSLDKSVDTVIIAGMGGINICNILMTAKNNLENVASMILSPHGDYELVRRVVVSLGYRIDDELVVTEAKKTYIIMSFKKANEPVHYTNLEYEYGMSGLSEKTKEVSIMNLKEKTDEDK